MALIDALLLDPAPFNVWIAYRTDGIKGSGTASDPFDGSTQARFDEAMSALPANARVHLGPGTFLTQGYAYNVSNGWQIKPGMKIIGSGIDITTLQLVNHTASQYYFAIGHDISAGAKADLAEVSDLTVHCNLAQAGAQTACSAVRLMGDHAKVLRVKAINWGSKDGNKPCSVLSCLTALPDLGVPAVASTGIEDCVVMTPGAGNIAACTALSAGNPDDVSFVADGHGKSPYIRNCFVDCGVATPNPDPAVGKYRGVAMGWCRGGVVEGNSIYNCDIGGPYQDGKRSARDIFVRNNFYKNVGRGPHWNLGTLGADRAQILSSSLSRSGTVGTVTNLAGFSDFDSAVRVKITTSPSDYTGVYVIRDKTSTSFTVNVPATGNSPVAVASARKIFGVSRAIIEGNVIELAQVSGAVAVAVADNNDSGSYIEAPDHVHGDIIIRNNKVRYVNGVAPNDGGAALIDLRGVQNVIVQNNVLDTIATLPIQTARCGTQSYFDNRTLSGALLAVPGFTANDFEETLALPAEDAFLMANFSKH